MAIKEYREFVLIAGDVKKDEDGLRQFTVQVFRTPGVGEGKKEVRELSPKLAGELSKLLYRLEHRKLGVEAIIALGEALADLLLPAKSRELFISSLDKLKPEQGLRLRLRLDPLLADIPWEYIYIQRVEGEKDTTGFLALDPRISIVRHEALPISGDIDTTPRPRRVLAAFASPEEPGYDPLDLNQERENLDEILRDLPNIELDVLTDATVDGLSGKLQIGADIFHFAGHGRYKVTGQGTSLRSIVGKGEIMLVKEDGTAAPMPADQLAVNLRGHGVQLVVLGACQTGRRDEQNVWSGVVAALMEVGIPAAVTMQYKIWDDAAIAFSRSFYQALAAGFPLDGAVSAGRMATFNLCHANAKLGKYWRDWGVAVLYLRSEGDFVLPAIVDDSQRRALGEGLGTVIDHRFGEIGPKGKYVAVEAGIIAGGSIESYLKVGTLRGKVTQVDAETISGGDISAKGEADVVEGEWTGVRVNNFGGSGSRARSVRKDQPETTGPTCPACHSPVQDGWKFCPNCRSDLVLSQKYCTKCGEKIPSGAKFCAKCGTEVEASPTSDQ